MYMKWSRLYCKTKYFSLENSFLKILGFMLKICLCILFNRNQELSTLLDGSHNHQESHNFMQGVAEMCSSEETKKRKKNQYILWKSHLISRFLPSSPSPPSPSPILSLKILRRTLDDVSTSFVVYINCECANKTRETTLCFNQFWDNKHFF